MAPHSDPTPLSSPVLGASHSHSEVPQHVGSDLVEPSESTHPGPGLDLGLGAVELWLDPFGGMAGDMFLAGLLDMGKPQFGLGHLQELAEDLLPGEARLSSSRVLRQGIAGQHLEVRT
ncbi:MAG: DUF111 family protein, partial [Planctomycetota bacterium]|nr:DUF111 family protein [Planctomycetota bacterium]